MSGKPNKKWLQTRIRKLGSYEAVIAYQRDIGALGGSVRGVKKGFAANPALASEVGSIGGSRSKRQSPNNVKRIVPAFDEACSRWPIHPMPSILEIVATELSLSRQTVVKYLRSAGRI